MSAEEFAAAVRGLFGPGITTIVTLKRHDSGGRHAGSPASLWWCLDVDQATGSAGYLWAESAEGLIDGIRGIAESLAWIGGTP